MFGKKQKQTPGRAVSGRQQAPVFSYYSNRSRPDMATGRGENALPVRRTAPKRAFKPYLLSGTLILLLLFNLGLSTSPKVVSTKPIDKTLLRSLSVYETGGQDILEHSIFNRTKITFNSRKFSSEFAKSYPEAGQVAVRVPLVGSRPTVELTPAAPAFIMTAVNGAYVIDDRGIAVLPLKGVRSSIQQSLPTLQDDVGLSIELGKAVLPKDNIIFITYLLNQLQAKNYKVQAMSLPAVANELDIRLEGKNFTVKTNLSADPAQQAGAILATLKKFDTDNTTPKEYLDVRVEERAYFK
jgi:hypothetical protein